jgi:hypothetical protein
MKCPAVWIWWIIGGKSIYHDGNESGRFETPSIVGRRVVRKRLVAVDLHQQHSLRRVHPRTNTVDDLVANATKIRLLHDIGTRGHEDRRHFRESPLDSSRQEEDALISQQAV